MITFVFSKIHFSITFGFLFLIAVNSASADSYALLCIMFCAVHELSHLAVMSILGISTEEIKFYGGGIKICGCGVELMDRPKKAAVYSAGCISNIVMFSLFFILGSTEYAMINLCIALYNLLPVEYFDGGKLLSIVFPHSDKCLKTVSNICISIVLASIAGSVIFISHSISPSAVLTVAFIVVSELLD